MDPRNIVYVILNQLKMRTSELLVPAQRVGPTPNMSLVQLTGGRAKRLPDANGLHTCSTDDSISKYINRTNPTIHQRAVITWSFLVTNIALPFVAPRKSRLSRYPHAYPERYVCRGSPKAGPCRDRIMLDWLILFIIVTVWYIQVHIYGYTILIPSPTGLICHYKQLVIISSEWLLLLIRHLCMAKTPNTYPVLHIR